MSIRQKTLQTVAMAGVIAMMLFLAGCGGGGGGGPSGDGDGDGGMGGMGGMGGDGDDMGPFMLPATSEMFSRLNAMDVKAEDTDDPNTDIDETSLEELRMAEVDRFVTRMAQAVSRGGVPGDGSGMESSSNKRKIGTTTNIGGFISGATASWFGEGSDQSDLTITITPDNSNSNHVDITPLVMNHDPDSMNFTKIGGLDDVFMHGFEIWREGEGNAEDQARAIVFTDKQQGTAAIEKVTAVPEAGLVNAPTAQGAVRFDLNDVSADKRTITDVMYFEFVDSPPPVDADQGFAYTGTLNCPAGTSCNYEVDANGDISITGYQFTGTRPAREAVTGVEAKDGSNDYIVFGLWLYENNADDLESFGAFAWSGGNFLERDTSNPDLVSSSGKADYSGRAFGAHQVGGVISWFDANANLQIDLGLASSRNDNIITGRISNIRIAGGEPLEENIFLGGPYGGTGIVPADFTARMGPSVDNPYSQDWEFTGFWDYDRFGPSESQNPQIITGTFGVSNSDDTESFVGAFGTRRVTE